MLPVIDELMREKVKTLSKEEKEQLIQDLGVTHMAFENWLCGRSKLVNSKVKNKCKHLLKIRVNFEEFRDMVNDMSECCEECDEIEDAEMI